MLAVLSWRRATGRRARGTATTRPLGVRLAQAGAFPLAAVALALVVGQAACGSSQTPPPPAPSVSLSPATLTFGAVNVQSTSAAQTVALTNSGKATLTITGISATGDFAQTNTCGTSVAAGGSCSIAVTFTPAAAGQRTGSISIADNAAGSPHIISLAGTGQTGSTPRGAHTMSITGSSGTLVQSGTVTLVVQ